MTPSTHDARPPYQQAAEAIRAEIKAGKLKPGEQLPSHRELQERFGIANMTARSALRVLREEGLIYTVQGRGSYVADFGPNTVVGVVSGPVVQARTVSDPGSAQADGALIETLQAVRDQLRALNAEVQTLKREVAELKSQQRS
ncbi:GntR family transcriptional regulator [Streptomyces sp. MK37H]|uniref:GntR family transcriptional regulator n=1 Tax=Streptomyces sp. MK37H TaxID=2699117 RepID=UPI001B38B283|nr:GntR family transcriptional regulator [Streptomyces sp. MK37H]MBP8532899.1 GntR family transcriptional regulator [Streptomyces sp. MK37H]